MHLYWSNGVVSWEVNALYNLWKDSGHGDLNRFFSLEWKTVGTQSNTKSWRNSLCHESMFAGVAYKGSASNLQFFFPLFEHFLDGCWQNNDTFAVALQSVQALRRITIELRSLAREDVQPLSEFQELQRTHHDLTKKAFGYDHIKPKHHARFHIVKQVATHQFYVDCFPGEKKHRVFKSHIGLHRFDGWNNSAAGQFGFFVMRQMLQHRVELLKQFDFSNSLQGVVTVDNALAILLKENVCHVSNSLQYMGRTISSGDVLLGAHPGLVLGGVQAGNKLFVRMHPLTLRKEGSFVSFWKKESTEKLVPVSLAGRSPMWWLDQEDDIVRCLH